MTGPDVKRLLACCTKLVIGGFALVMMFLCLVMLCAGCAVQSDQLLTPDSVFARNDTLFITVRNVVVVDKAVIVIPAGWCRRIK